MCSNVNMNILGRLFVTASGRAYTVQPMFVPWDILSANTFDHLHLRLNCAVVNSFEYFFYLRFGVISQLFCYLHILP